MIRLEASPFTVDAAAPDGAPSRTISGIAVTYNTPATVADGTQVMFLPGSLPTTGRSPKLFNQHNAEQIIGIVNNRQDTDQGMLFSAKIAPTVLGNEILTLCGMGIIDGVSVGVTPTKWHFNDQHIMVIEECKWSELSTVSEGAFAGALITEVAASIPQDEPEISTIETEPTEETEPMSDTTSTPVEAAPAPQQLWAEPAREFRMPTPGEYMAAFHIGGATFAKVNAAYKVAADKQKSAFEFGATDTGDFPGTLPLPVISPVVQNLNYIRPLVTALGARALPNGNGFSFIRPTISTHTSAAVQASQNTDVSQTAMVVAANQVERITVGGSAVLSMQLVDFTDPAALNVILNDLMGQYMLATDAVACDALNSASQSSGTWDGVSAAGLLTALYTAAYDASVGTNFFVDTLVLPVKQWQYLGQLVDDSDRPVFPAIGAPGLLGMNTLGAGSAAQWSGQNPLGLQTVVDSQLDAIDNKNLTLINASRSFEFYENMRGLMTVEQPSKIAREFSYSGTVATFAAIPSMIRYIQNTD